MPESTINKTLLTILTVFTILSICIGASNLFMGLRGDVTDIQEDLAKNEISIDNNLSSIHMLEVQNTRLETQFSEIMRRLDELNAKLDKFEVVL